jgi:two-component system chemotaxis response regulator CheB
MIRLLIVDDSPLVRRLLTESLKPYPDIDVVGTAEDAYSARDKIIALRPDVITLDIEMPRMDGLSFLQKIMHYFPLPVIILSSLTPEGGAIGVTALRLGAVDVIGKPRTPASIPEVNQRLLQAIRAAAKTSIQAKLLPRGLVPAPLSTLGAYAGPASRQVVAIGSSTGGVHAMETVLRQLPATCPGVVISQHIPANFSAPLAERLSGLCSLQVREAADNDRVLPGTVLIAPGDRHMMLTRDAEGYAVRVKDGPAVNRQRPSVDVLFDSVARVAGADAVGVILTGMGNDGAAGLLAMRKTGAYTIAEDESTCVVYGMPKQAVAVGAVQESAPLPLIPQAILQALGRTGARVESRTGG